MNCRKLRHDSGPAPQQDGRATRLDHVAPAAARRGPADAHAAEAAKRFAQAAGRIGNQQRQTEYTCPQLPFGDDVVGMLGRIERHRQGRIAMLERNRNAVCSVFGRWDEPQGDAQERRHRHVDRHADAANGAVQHHALAGQFDMAHALVGAGIGRGEMQGQGERVEPRHAARPDGEGPAERCLTPQDRLPAGLLLMSRSLAGTMRASAANPLKILG